MPSRGDAGMGVGYGSAALILNQSGKQDLRQVSDRRSASWLSNLSNLNESRAAVAELADASA